ncbi:MAG TPA: hypothetical protein VGI82_11675 [Chitinophagaceae bacterium]
MRKFSAAIYALILPTVMLLLVVGCKKNKDSDSLVITPTVNPAPYTTMVYLVTPLDQTFNPDYYKVAKSTLLRIQQWYKDQLGTNKTFVLNPVVVDTLKGLHNSSWYNSYNPEVDNNNSESYGYYNAKYEMKHLLGPGFDTVHYTYFVYVAADLTDATIPRGIAAQGSSALEGLMGRTPEYFIGGAAHSLGHALGIQEPPVQDTTILMSEGYKYWPNCVFQQSEKDSLNASPFFKMQ